MVLIWGIFYIEIKIVKIKKGDYVFVIWVFVNVGWFWVFFGLVEVEVILCVVFLDWKWNVVFGFQNFKKIVSVKSEMSVDKILGSFGFKKLELINWVRVKEMLDIKIVGSIFIVFLNFVIIKIKYSGINIEIKGSWWFIILEIFIVVILVGFFIVVIGILIVLKVIGVVFVNKYKLVVYSGLNFKFISRVVEIVIGVLKLVVFLRKVLNEKVINKVWSLWFFVIDMIEVWIILNWLVFMVSL